MQDDKQNNQPLEDDILQSKADIREAMNMFGHSPSAEPVDDMPADISPKSEADDTFLEAELVGMETDIDDALPADVPKAESRTPQKQNQPIPIRSVPQPQPEQEKSDDRQTLQKNLETLKSQLRQKDKTLAQQADRLEFLEKQLQHAIVLERAKSRFQQEVQTLNEKNHQLTAQLAQLKTRPEGGQPTNTSLEPLQAKLETAESALSEQQTLLRLSQETTETLREELASYKQNADSAQSQLDRKDRSLAQLQSAHEQLRRDYERLRTGKDDELTNTSNALNELQKQYRQLEEDTEQIRHEYEAFQTQANEEIRLLTERNDALENQNASLSEEVNRLKEENARISEALTLHESAAATDKTIREELAKTQRQKDELAKRLQTAQSVETDLRSQIEQFRISTASAEAMREELAAVRHQTEELLRRNRTLEQQLEQLHNQVDEPEVADELFVPPTESFEDEPAPEDNDVVPAFNLAEQIMEEHRRSVAGRRRRVEPVAAISQSRSIRDVMQHYVSSAASDTDTDDTPANTKHHLWIDQSLTPFQQEILQEIVRNDMQRYTQNSFTMTGYASMTN